MKIMPSYNYGASDYECPLCGKKGVKVTITPAHREAKVGRGSGQSSTVYSFVPEKIEVITDCSECGVKKSVIQKVIDGKLTVAEAKSGKKKKKCKFCGEPFEGPGRLCPQCKEWED